MTSKIRWVAIVDKSHRTGDVINDVVIDLGELDPNDAKRKIVEIEKSVDGETNWRDVRLMPVLTVEQFEKFRDCQKNGVDYWKKD